MNEPADLWLRRLDRRYRHRAPRIEARGALGDVFIAEGVPPKTIGLGMSAGKNKSEYEFAGTLDQARAGGWDPDARLVDQDIDSVAAEVVYPTNAMQLFRMPSRELQRMSCRVYNDWVSEFCSAHPGRLIGIGIVPVGDPEVSASEIERAAALGLRGVMIPAEAPEGMTFADRRFDRLWAAAQDHALPLSLHTFTSARPMAGSGFTRWLTGRLPRTADFARRLLRPAGPLHGSRGELDRALPWARGIVEAPRRTQTSLCDLVLGGVFVRFPGLEVVSVENDIGWIAHFIERLDTVYETHRFWMGLPALPALPSELFRAHAYATFTTDRAGMATRHLVGVERLMWGSDYPHSMSTWPRSIQLIDRDLDGVPADERRQMLVDNVCKLYGVALGE